ncbi:unnamed protein product, partial [Darwinula stevensoni]
AEDTEKEKKNDKAEDEEEETAHEEGRSQSSSKSWSTAPNAAKSKKIPRAIRTGRENAPRPGIKKEIPQRPRMNKEFQHIPRIEKQRARCFPETTLAEEMKGLAKLIQSGVDGKPAIYELWKSVVVENKEMGIAKFDIGPRLRKQDERVLMVVGKTGAGKTTMINSLANYVYGVRWEDDFRFKVITEKGDVNANDKANSQTKGVSAYTFNWKEGMTIPYTLTVIDTPGFADSEGLHKDEELVVKLRHAYDIDRTPALPHAEKDIAFVVENKACRISSDYSFPTTTQLTTTKPDIALLDKEEVELYMREFFEICEPRGLKSVNAVGFVLPASNARLTAAEKYIFHAITQLFAIDTKEKFVVLVSFCDGQEPAVIAVIKKAKLHYQDYHTFNNSAMFACSRDP